MSYWSANLKMPYMAAGQAQKHVTHNEALELLDALVQLIVSAFDVSTPPLSPNDAEVWSIGLGAVNEWAGHDGDLAIWSNGGWLFVTPQAGWRAASGDDLRVHDGSGWVTPPLPDLNNVPGLGVYTSHDPVNVLAVAGEASLFTNDGAGHQIKINKAATGDTASVLFQTGWSGRAEFGLAGSDNWSVKVSPDGTTWYQSLSTDANSGMVNIANGLSVSGAVSLPAGSLNLSGAAFTGALPIAHGGTGATSTTSARTALGLGSAATSDATTGPTDVTAGRLVRVGDGYVKASILGAVSESAGVPTGAIIQRGSNANGTFVRFADGTQICTATLTMTYASATILTRVWTFPATFIAAPFSTYTMSNQPSDYTNVTIRDLGAMVAYTGSSTSAVFNTYRSQGAVASFNASSVADATCALAIGRWY